MSSHSRDVDRDQETWLRPAGGLSSLAYDRGETTVLPGDELGLPAYDPFAAKMEFRVELPTYRGPLDLLLYLVRKHELEVTEIPIALITDQYLGYLEILEQLDVDAVGDFIEFASLLIEMKSRMVLPQEAEAEAEEAIADDPRDELVQRLLEYKEYKDAASVLSESSQQWQQRFPRLANELPPQVVDPTEQPLHETALWDLVSAMGRLMRERERLKPVTNIVYDDTPIQVYMRIIHQRLMQQEAVLFTSLFATDLHKSKMIGIFLAILELTRNYGVTVEQADVHGEMRLTPGPDFQPSWDVNEAFTDFDEASNDSIPAKPR